LWDGWQVSHLENQGAHSSPHDTQQATPSHGSGHPVGDRMKVGHDLGVVKLVNAAPNLALCHQPLYSLPEWAAHFDPAAVGLLPDEVRLLNDDRVGRALVSLFDADRASLLNRPVLDMVAAFCLDCSQLHNDSTSVTLQGTYRDADGQPRGSKATVALVRGHSKDHRPDLEQLVFILTICADGAVPAAGRTADGNTEDSTTHVATWDSLVALFGRADFLYVADCKLATRDSMVRNPAIPDS